jgi:hypothetical protein
MSNTSKKQNVMSIVHIFFCQDDVNIITREFRILLKSTIFARFHEVWENLAEFV